MSDRIDLSQIQPDKASLPLVEIFETVEGEGTKAGYPTVFIRLFGCPLRCSWCDTTYSYPPYQAADVMTIKEICENVKQFSATHVCLTGGEPLLHGDKSALLLQELAKLDGLVDIHVETAGSIPLHPFLRTIDSPKVRYIMDYKLLSSGESHHMHLPNLEVLRPQDELKFVVADDADFDLACHVLDVYRPAAVVLFSPVWGSMEPKTLVQKMLAKPLPQVKLSLQIHKVIWDPQQRGV